MPPTSNVNVLLGGIHDSSSPPACTTMTLRSDEERLSRLVMSQPDNSCELLWVHGPAGVGKTSITRSLAQKHILGPNANHTTPPSEKFPGSSFFFSRKDGITDPRKFFITLAYGLARSRGNPALAPHRLSAFGSVPHILELSLQEQCDTLIVEPLRAWASSQPGGRNILMIIDGLEQCDGGEATQIKIINIIHQTFSNLAIDGIKWRWIISSRSESWIHSTFHQLQTSQMKFIPISLASPEETEKYISNKAGLRPRPDPPSLWSSSLADRARDNLCWHSNGYMAYLASLFAYINEPGAKSTERLREVTSHVEYASFKHKSSNMFSQLDAMYHDILSRVRIRSQEIAKRVLGAISHMQPSNSNGVVPRATTVVTLLGISLEELYDALYHLNSVVSSPVQRTEGSFTDPEMTFYHKSFDAFLRNPTRSCHWSINSTVVHADLAKGCLKMINAGLDLHSQNTDMYVSQRWFVHCWRTDSGAEDSVEAAFGIFPELYELNFNKLGERLVLDRYFVEWLLRVQEMTMSEYLLLNPGPDYAPEQPLPWSYTPNSSSTDWSSFPSTSLYSSAFDGVNQRRGPRMRELPPRPTYILGIEPSKQVLLVPMFEEKDYRRQDLNISVIGPNERCWDLIRGFQVKALPENLGEGATAEGGNLDGGNPSMIPTERRMVPNDYDEFVARSLAWEEENGGGDYEQLVARSLAWEEENGQRFAEAQNQPEHAPIMTISENHVNEGDDSFRDLLAALNVAHIPESDRVEDDIGDTEDQQQLGESVSTEGDMYGEIIIDRYRLSSVHSDERSVADVSKDVQEGLVEGPDDPDGSDSDSEIVVVGPGDSSHVEHDTNIPEEEEAFELIQREEAFDHCE